MKTDHPLVQAALVGYQAQLENIDRAIADIQAMLRQRPAKASLSLAPRKKRVLSAAARNRVAAAQKKRWAEYHKAKKKAEG
jgi:hypothetical protein